MIWKTIVNNETGLVYHLQKGSGKSGWKENVTRLFGSFQRMIFREQRNIEKMALFVPDGIFRTKSHL